MSELNGDRAEERSAHFYEAIVVILMGAIGVREEAQWARVISC